MNRRPLQLDDQALDALISKAMGDGAVAARNGDGRPGLLELDDLSPECEVERDLATFAAACCSDWREPVPAALRSKLDAAAAGWVAASRAASALPQKTAAPARSDDLRGPIPITSGRQQAAQRRSGQWSRLWAIAATLALAVVVGSRAWSSGSAPTQATTDAKLAALRAVGDVVEWAWSAGPDATGQAVTGSVVWSASRQEGYMCFKGLASNDPRAEQYQLWIFDARRDERYPVHGGVFDAPRGSGELVVPIDPRLRVEDLAAFVVTVERPGGVWVSDRSRISAIAKKPA